MLHSTPCVSVYFSVVTDFRLLVYHSKIYNNNKKNLWICLDPVILKSLTFRTTGNWHCNIVPCSSIWFWLTAHTSLILEQCCTYSLPAHPNRVWMELVWQHTFHTNKSWHTASVTWNCTHVCNGCGMNCIAHKGPFCFVFVLNVIWSTVMSVSQYVEPQGTVQSCI